MNESDAAARQLVDKVGLSHKIEAYPLALSSGQKRAWRLPVRLR
jgi:ABC-type polar amino acid transport system ATPase subunit